jgi:ketosteroid isomerase-like protein
MPSGAQALEADRDFFAALVGADGAALARLLVDDFVIIEVTSGAAVPRGVLVLAVATGRLRFERIDPVDAEHAVRQYGDTAIVTGRTEMSGTYQGTPFAATSRYTHVFVAEGDRWRLANAQGTPITAPG